MQRRCDRNRKRSKRRAIYCPIHGCYLDSQSCKYTLFADSAGQLQQRGVSQKEAKILIANKTTIAIQGEWLEAFWCNDCQKTKYYHVRLHDGKYEVSVASPQLWRQAVGVINPDGNSSVSEFTRRHSRKLGYQSNKNFPQ
ncbi:MAG: hypothetical protein IGS39_23505 [Calothrix sp. C42_A2020_038]|nr:hypothetical protein [Calothrix sp. C42_A2020_038]